MNVKCYWKGWKISRYFSYDHILCCTRNAYIHTESLSAFQCAETPLNTRLTLTPCRWLGYKRLRNSDENWPMRSKKTSCWLHQNQNTGRSESRATMLQMDSQLKMADAGCWVEMGQCSSSLLSPQWLSWSQTCEPRFRHLPLVHRNLHSRDKHRKPHGLIFK